MLERVCKREREREKVLQTEIERGRERESDRKLDRQTERLEISEEKLHSNIYEEKKVGSK